MANLMLVRTTKTAVCSTSLFERGGPPYNTVAILICFQTRNYFFIKPSLSGGGELPTRSVWNRQIPPYPKSHLYSGTIVNPFALASQTVFIIYLTCSISLFTSVFSNRRTYISCFSIYAVRMLSYSTLSGKKC